MHQILELRAKRAKRGRPPRTFSTASAATAGGSLPRTPRPTTGWRPMAIGRKVERLERQAAIGRDLSLPVDRPLAQHPEPSAAKGKADTATDEYKAAFWRTMRAKSVPHEVLNAPQMGAESESGYLAPDEYQRTPIEALEEQNIFRQLAHVISTSSGDRMTPAVASKGTASWIDKEAVHPESDDSFGQVSSGAYKLADRIREAIRRLGINWDKLQIWWGNSGAFCKKNWQAAAERSCWRKSSG